MSRPRSFNEEHVVASAMALFWERGFEGTSLDALERTTGLNRSSLYNTFGGKVELFGRVLDAYRDGPCRLMERPLREERGAAALREYFEELRAFVTSPSANRGCMMVNTALESEVTPDTQRRVRLHFATLRGLLRAAYQAGVDDGEIQSSLDPEEATDWLLTFVRGVLSSAASGEEGQVLERSLSATSKQLGLL